MEREVRTLCAASAVTTCPHRSGDLAGGLLLDASVRGLAAAGDGVPARNQASGRKTVPGLSRGRSAARSLLLGRFGPETARSATSGTSASGWALRWGSVL